MKEFITYFIVPLLIVCPALLLNCNQDSSLQQDQCTKLCAPYGVKSLRINDNGICGRLDCVCNSPCPEEKKP